MSGRTKIKLPWQTKVNNTVDLNQQSITNLVMPEDKTNPEPVSDTDVVNRQYVASVVIDTGQGGKIGDAEDGNYTDGLFKDFVPETLIGTAVDRFNEILKALAPSPAPSLSNIGIQDAGVTGKLSFGSSNSIAGYTSVAGKDVGDTFGAQTDEAGIFQTGVLINGDIASTVPAGGDNERPYPAKAFGDADKGTLHLEVNGTIIQSVDLTSFVGGISVNANNSGFILSTAAPVEFDSGDTLDLFKYRTGTWQVAFKDQIIGYNYVRVRHEYETDVYRDTNTYGWVVDNTTDLTVFSGESLSNPTMAGSRQISGVTYHTSGTIDYSITISNAYKNTYSASLSAIDFSGINTLPIDMALTTPSAETDDIVISGNTITIDNSNRLLNDDVYVKVAVDRTVVGDDESAGVTISGFLVDNITENAGNTREFFNGEMYRINSSVDITDTNYGTGGQQASAYDWDSSQHLISGDTNHNDGLLISGGRLSYPSNTSHIANITGGDFSAAVLGPGGNPDYQTASGNRTYLRYFFSQFAYSNFRLNIDATDTTFTTVAAGPSGNAVTLEILAPNTTKDNNGAVEWKDAVEPHDANDRDIGCFASTFGDTIPTNWGLTLGSENTSTSGNVILIRITASASWTGSINSIILTWV